MLRNCFCCFLPLEPFRMHSHSNIGCPRLHNCKSNVPKWSKVHWPKMGLRIVKVLGIQTFNLALLSDYNISSAVRWSHHQQRTLSQSNWMDILMYSLMEDVCIYWQDLKVFCQFAVEVFTLIHTRSTDQDDVCFGIASAAFCRWIRKAILDAQGSTIAGNRMCQSDPKCIGPSCPWEKLSLLGIQKFNWNGWTCDNPESRGGPVADPAKQPHRPQCMEHIEMESSSWSGTTRHCSQQHLVSLQLPQPTSELLREYMLLDRPTILYVNPEWQTHNKTDLHLSNLEYGNMWQYVTMGSRRFPNCFIDLLLAVEVVINMPYQQKPWIVFLEKINSLLRLRMACESNGGWPGPWRCDFSDGKLGIKKEGDD